MFVSIFYLNYDRCKDFIVKTSKLRVFENMVIKHMVIPQDASRGHTPGVHFHGNRKNTLPFFLYVSVTLRLGVVV